MVHNEPLFFLLTWPIMTYCYRNQILSSLFCSIILLWPHTHDFHFPLWLYPSHALLPLLNCFHPPLSLCKHLSLEQEQSGEHNMGQQQGGEHSMGQQQRDGHSGVATTWWAATTWQLKGGKTSSWGGECTRVQWRRDVLEKVVSTREGDTNSKRKGTLAFSLSSSLLWRSQVNIFVLCSVTSSCPKNHLWWNFILLFVYSSCHSK